jgi:hypothetical protein
LFDDFVGNTQKYEEKKMDDEEFNIHYNKTRWIIPKINYFDALPSFDEYYNNDLPEGLV